jgi:ribonuclease VapC
MMFVDASALIAIVANEIDGAALGARLEDATKAFTSPIAVYEATLGLARIGKTSPAEAKVPLDRLLRETNVEVIAIETQMAELALAAFSRFGKGRHPAGLNMGDCFAYACAKELGVPLLFKGDDFAKTDIEVA